MRNFDASSIIYAWDNYPILQFPKLWEWIDAEIQAKEFSISGIAFEEVKGKTPECAQWLTNVEILKISITNLILDEALRIQGLLGIQNDQYGSGVGENDILIIATAKIEGVDLISDENKQPNLPEDMKKYKIPAVCALPSVQVGSLNFLELIKNSGSTF